MAFTPAQLKAEIDADPKSLGLVAMRNAGDQQGIASKLSEQGTVPADTIFKAWTPLEEIVACLVRADFDALSAAGKTYWDQVVCRTARVKTGNTTYRTQIGALFPAGTTRDNLVAVASRQCSRAEFLWGENTTISASDVATALAT